MDRLLEGFRRFRDGYFKENQATFAALAKGQAPESMVIACSDSRIDPQLIFGAELGEIFVVRNVANLIPPYAPNNDYHSTSAALEFAVHALKVKNIVVLGHSGCGGIAALVSGIVPTQQTDFLMSWMRIAEGAKERARAKVGAILGKTDDIPRWNAACEREAIRTSLDNLMTFPCIIRRVNQGRLQLSGWLLDFEQGELETVGGYGTAA